MGPDLLQSDFKAVKIITGVHPKFRRLGLDKKKKKNPSVGPDEAGDRRCSQL